MRGLTTVCLSLIATGSLALADDGPPPAPSPLEVSLFGGGFISNYYHQFYDPALESGDSTPTRANLERVMPELGARFALFPHAMFGVEAEASMILASTKETGDSAQIYGLGLHAVVQKTLGKVTPFAVAGFSVRHIRSDAMVLGNDSDFPLHVGVGARYWLSSRIAIRADARFIRGPSYPHGGNYTLNASYGEFMVGMSYRPSGGSAPSAEDNDRRPPPDADTDGDGVVDANDKCPSEPEDKDLFDDGDGCPDLDNDADGVLDTNDKCPLEAEDKDGFADDDGCDDKDNDADGILDSQDKCPSEPEDRDNFEDADGCPDLDNDNDGFSDAQDKCPNEAEVINGVDDDDGCADRGNSLVVVSPDRLELLEAVSFKKTVIQKSSFNLLGQIGATMRAHPEIKRLRITVHVQPTKKPDADQQLSDLRAFAIREWLIQYGVAEDRLDPRGFGGTKPLVDPKTKGAAAINDRVDLIILERE